MPRIDDNIAGRRAQGKSRMETLDLKRKLTGLWKDTFHDTDEYIRLWFDKYYDPRWTEYEQVGNEIVSMLFGVPYEFGGAEGKIRGLYLCGLATNAKYRGQGLMSKLMDRINDKAREAGFAFTFLIPSSEHLIRFYSHHGYVKAFYRNQLNYTALHNFKNEYEFILEEQKDKVAELKRKLYASLNGKEVEASTPVDKVNEIVDLLMNAENAQTDMSVRHSREDLHTAIKENDVSGGKIYYTENGQGKVTAVAFTTLIDRSRVDIERLFSSDDCSTYRLLDHIKHAEPDAGIRIYVRADESEWKNLAEVHGMARVLDLSEILKFQAAGLKDLKYSILVNEVPGQVERYDVRSGNVKHRSIEIDSEDFDQNKTVMSLKDMSSVLFRRPDTGVLITEAFGMPSVGGYLNLMLD